MDKLGQYALVISMGTTALRNNNNYCVYSHHSSRL